ncbi:MAG: hypothetical protein AAFQ79_14475 [Pseudomonadota bacterium]
MKQSKTSHAARRGFWARLLSTQDGRHRASTDRPTKDRDFLRKYADARMDQPRMWL